MKNTSFLAVAVSWFFTVLPLGKAEEPKKDPVPSIPVSKLIEDLDHDQFKRRSAAKSQLFIRGKESVPELLNAIDQSKNSNIRDEAKKLVDRLLRPDDEDTVRRQLGKLTDYAKNRQLDRFIETIVIFRDSAGETERELILDLAKSLLNEMNENAKMQMPYPKVEHHWYCRIDRTSETGLGATTTYASVLEKAKPGMIARSTVVCSHLDLVEGEIRDSVVLCSGNLDAVRIVDSVVIVLGDYRMASDDKRKIGSICRSLILCSGNIECYGIVRESIAVAGSEFDTDNKYPGSHIGQRSKTAASLCSNSGCFAGIKLAATKEKVLQIRNVSQDSHWYRNGLRASNQILAINNTPVSTVDEFKRNVLCAIAFPGYVVVTVRQPHELTRRYFVLTLTD